MNRRQADILELLNGQREVTIRDLARRFDVTAMTVRRDLDRLEEQGKVARTHGGAIPARAGVVAFAFAEKERRRSVEKKAIARAVAAMVTPGMTVALDTGTTTLEVARALARATDVTVLTTSLAIASVLHPYERIQVVLLGGTMRKSDPDLVGVLAETNLRSFRVELAVMGADAASPDGAFSNDMGVARVSQAMMAGAARKVLAVDAGKFAASALFRFAEWGAFDGVVTDAGVPAGVRTWLDAAVARVTYAEPDGREARAV